MHPIRDDIDVPYPLCLFKKPGGSGLIVDGHIPGDGRNVRLSGAARATREQACGGENEHRRKRENRACALKLFEFDDTVNDFG